MAMRPGGRGGLAESVDSLGDLGETFSQPDVDIG
jgi:hypothetical protein